MRTGNASSATEPSAAEERLQAVRTLVTLSDYVRDDYCVSAAERAQHDRDTRDALLALGVTVQELDHQSSSEAASVST